MQKKSRTEYSLLNILTGLGGYIINTVLGFVCRMVFVRCLSSSYLGINGLMTNFLSMLSLAELGIGSAIIYALYKPIAENDKEKVASLMRIYKYAYAVIGTVVALVGVCMMPCLKFVIGDAPEIKENICIIYGIYLFNTASSYFFSYRSSLVTAYQRNYIVVGLSYVITSVQSVVQIVFLIYFESYMPYLVIQTIGTQLYNILITVWTNREYPFIRKKHVAPLPGEEKRGLFKNVKSVTVYKLSGVLVNHTDNLVITFFSGLGISGLASNYTLLVNTLDTLIKQIFNAVTASVGNLNAEDDTAHQYAFFRALNLTNFWIYGWAALGVVFVSSDLVSLFFGESYVMDWKIPLILGINLYMVGMQNAVWTYKNTKGMFKYGQYLLLVTAALNIGGDIVLGSLWGVLGIYLATAIARGLTNTWYEPYVVYKIAFGVSPVVYLKKYIHYLITLLAAGVICYFICRIISFNIVMNILLKLIVCSAVPNALFAFAFCRTEEFVYIRQIAKTAFSLIKRKLKH